MSDREKWLEEFAKHIAQSPGMALNADSTVIQQLGWSPSADEHRRAFIIENFGYLGEYCSDPEWWFQWMKNGPAAPNLSKPPLRPVK